MANDYSILTAHYPSSMKYIWNIWNKCIVYFKNRQTIRMGVYLLSDFYLFLVLICCQFMSWFKLKIWAMFGFLVSYTNSEFLVQMTQSTSVHWFQKHCVLCSCCAMINLPIWTRFPSAIVLLIRIFQWALLDQTICWGVISCALLWLSTFSQHSPIL